jgi:hypothetical protein
LAACISTAWRSGLGWSVAVVVPAVASTFDKTGLAAAFRLCAGLPGWSRIPAGLALPGMGGGGLLPARCGVAEPGWLMAASAFLALLAGVVGGRSSAFRRWWTGAGRPRLGLGMAFRDWAEVGNPRPAWHSLSQVGAVDG